MFKGSIPALVTPFGDRGELDIAGIDRLVEFHLENHSDGLVVAGTTGESATLSREEFRILLGRVVERVDGRLPVMAGTGGASTAATIAATAEAAGLGADAALVVTPYYNCPPQAGLAAHFSAVADAANIPIVLYNVPSRSGVDLLPDTVISLCAHPRIAGIKESVADPARIEQLIEGCGPGFIVLSGDDKSSLRSMKHGAVGVISVAANVVPAAMHELCRAALERNWGAAEATDARLHRLYEVLMIETNPIPVKWSLFAMRLCGPHLRLPLLQLDVSQQGRVRQVLLDLGLVQA